MIDQILNLGDDQLANQYQIVFPSGVPTGDTSILTLRMDETFDPPQEVIVTYDINYKGSLIKKTSKKEETAKEFTINIRLDQGWLQYDLLKNWLKSCYNPITNISEPDLTTRVPMVIQALDQNNTVVKNITFRFVKINGLKIGTFDHGSGDPVKIEASFIYGTMEND